MKTASPLAASARRHAPGFAAGLALGALGALLFSRPGPGPVPPPGDPPDSAPPEAPRAGRDGAALPTNAPPFEAPLPEPPPLKWEISPANTPDDRFPVWRVSANRNVFAPDSTNGMPWITIRREGEPVAACLVGAWDESKDGVVPNVSWLFVTTESNVEPGEFEVRISKDFPDPAGRPPAADEVWLGNVSPEPLRFLHVESEADPFGAFATTRLWTSRELDAAALAKALVFDPDVPGASLRLLEEGRSWTDEAGVWHWRDDDPCYEVRGAFSPGARYRVRFASRWVFDDDGYARFASTNATAFTAKAPKRAVEWLDPGLYLGGGKPVVALRADRVPRAKVTVRRVLPASAVHALRHLDDWRFDLSEWCDKPVERRIERFAPDGIATNAVSLADFVPAPAGGAAGEAPAAGEGAGQAPAAGEAPTAAATLPEGIWHVRVEGLAATNEPSCGEFPYVLERFVAFSDTALTVRLLDREAAVWTTGLSSGRPVADAAVTLFAANGTAIATGKTGTDGFVRLPVPEGAETPVLAVAERAGGSYAFLEISGENQSYDEPGEAADAFPKSDAELDAWVGSDRGIYRHGDRVHLEALVRDGTGAAPEPRPVALEIHRGDGVVVKRWNLVTDARGRVSPPGGFFEIPDSQPSGTWRAELRMPEKDGRVLGERPFRVESFVPPKIRVAIEGTPDFVAPASPADRKWSVDCVLSSDWLFGSPAAGLRWEASATATPAPFAPKGWEDGWRFGALSGGTGKRADTEKGTLGPDGKAAAKVGLPGWAGTPRPAAALSLRIQASVFEPGGRAVTEEKTLPLHVYPFYVGVKAPASAVPGGDVALPVRFALPDGTPAPDAAAAVRAELFSVRSDWIWEKRGDRWNWRENRIERKVGEGTFPVEDGTATVRFTLPQGDATYVARVEPAGDWPEDGALKPRTERRFSTRDGAGADESKSPCRLSFSADKKSYRPGDVARVDLSAPFDGLALVTFHGRGLLAHDLVCVTNGHALVEFPVEAGHAPSFDVAASLVRPAAPGAEWPEHRAYGATTLHVEDPARRLSPALSPPVAEPVPGGGWRVVAEAALANSPEASGAHATFFLVDQAVLGLTREKTPDPAGFLGRARRAEAALYDSFRRLLRMRDMPTLATVAIGGDDDLGPAGERRLQAARTRRFKPLALAVHDVPFENGVARAEFEVPEFSGEVRVVALAWSRGAAGAASAQRVLAPALVLDADAPRFLAPGDASEFTLSLHSTADEPALVSWSVAAAAVVSTNGAVPLGPKGSATVRVPVDVPAGAPGGELAAEFRAEGLGETHSATILLPLRPALPAAAVEESLVVAPGETARLAPAAGLLAASHAELSADPDAFAPFAPALRWLSSYPWRCLEQTVSRAFPLLASGGAACTLSPDAFADPDGELEAAVARVTTMLHPNSFSMWPDSGYEIPRYGARAGLFLAEAEAAGHRLPPSASAHLRDALRRYARMEAPDRRWDDSAAQKLAKDRAFSATRTTALLGLRAAGEADADYESALFDRSARLSPEARAQLALCLLRGGRRDEALELLRAAEPDASAESLAWALVAWCETDLPETADRVEALRSRLLDARGGDAEWGTTERNSAALLAAASALRRWGRSDAAPRLVATPDGAPPVAVTNAARAVALAPAAGAGTVSLRNDGDAPLLVRRVVEGVPDPASFHAQTNGIAVSRRLLAQDGEEVDPASGAVKRGDVLVVELSFEPVPDAGTVLEQVVVDELFPAGFEPAAGAAPGTTLPVMHSETRDDRLVVFALPFSGKKVFRHEVQAVSAGAFALPPLQASEMYRPSRNGRTAPGRLVVSGE